MFTQTGLTARRLASDGSPIPVLAFTPGQSVRSNLAFTWGVETFIAPTSRDAGEAIAQVDDTLLGLGRASPGERVVIVAGRPGRAGSTNTVLVHELGSR